MKLYSGPLSLFTAKDNLAGHHRTLDQKLEEQSDGDGYRVGSFSVADIGNFIFVNAAAALGAPFASDLTRLAGWFDKVRNRPTVRAKTTAMQEFMLKLQSGATR